MTAPVAMTNCPTAEMLAAFVDDRLDAAGRRTVIEHISECAECRDAVVMADDLRAEEAALHAPRPGEVRTFSRRAGWGIAVIAAAAALSLLFLQPIAERLFDPSGIGALVDASEALPYRPIDGRLTGGFPYKPRKETKRGGEDELSELALQSAALEIQAAAHERGGKARSLAAAHLLTGERDEAIATLAAELRKRTGAADLEHAVEASRDHDLLVDLSAAYLARGMWNGDNSDLARARAAADQAWRIEKTPEAAWNRAAATEHLGLTAEAARAWQDYLALDPSSAWAAEARRRLADLLER